MELYVIAFFLGRKGSFTFHAGQHVYEATIAYTSIHDVLTTGKILDLVEEIAFDAVVFPITLTSGNTSLTITQVS
jgi:hypothetical protein